MNELSLRIITASVLFAGAVGWLFYLPPFWFDIVLGLIAVAATVELLRMVDIAHRTSYGLVAMLAWVLLVAGHGAWAMLSAAWIVLMVGWLCLLIIYVKKGELETEFRKLAFAQWMMVWLTLFVLVMMQLHAHVDGIVFIAGACAGVWAADIAAYFTGKAWGKRKLCPIVSPGKTLEGLAGGVIAGIATAMSVWLIWTDISLSFALLLGIVLVFCAVLGDLAESTLKRAVGVKDSGNMLPGHGGLLDRIDALLPAIPATGFIWMAFI
ncbi:MAG: phosphatidate cytidylyltransferase [Mariprofundaceae bacterium]|nr:phosphatidate cytidylyltransferase [Mariprofundaceae bacterium]